MFDTQTYKREPLQKLKKIEDLFFKGIFATFPFFIFFMTKIKKCDPFFNCPNIRHESPHDPKASEDNAFSIFD